MLVHYFLILKNMTNNCQNGGGDTIEADIKKIMESRGVDAGRAERIRDVMEEFNLSEDEAAQLEERL